MQDPIQEVTPVRNLTHERVLAHLEREKQAALSQLRVGDSKVVAIPKLDKDGNPVMKNGMLDIVDQRVLTADIVAAEWDDRIAAARKEYAG